MGGLIKCVLIIKMVFLIGIFFFCGIFFFVCFWLKDEIFNDSLLFLLIFVIIVCLIVGLIVFYMFWIYLFIFEGYLNIYFLNYSGKKSGFFYLFFLWGKEEEKKFNKNFGLVLLLIMNNIKRVFFFCNKIYKISNNVRN